MTKAFPKAKFYDGRTSSSQSVVLTFSQRYMFLKFQDQQDPLKWDVEKIVVKQPYVQPQPAILSPSKNSDLRLHIDDPAVWKRVAARLPGQKSSHSLSQASWTGIFVLCVIILAGLLAAPFMFERSSSLVPDTWIDPLGDQMIEDYKASICKGPEGQRVLENIVTSLDPHSGKTGRPIKIHVIRSSEINAFAAPGGHIVILDGLIDFAKHPDEVTGIIAHEIAHIRENHVKESIVRKFGFQALMTLIFGDATLASILPMINEIQYSRKDEMEADQMAYEMLNRAKISPAGKIRFFERIREKEKESEMYDYLQFLSTHPATEDRIEAGRNYLRSENYQPSMTAQQWYAVQQMCSSGR